MIATHGYLINRKESMANNYFQIKFGNFFSFFRSSVELQVHELYSETLQRQVKLSIFLPPVRPWRFWERFPLVLFNYGQDMPAVRMQSQLRQLYARVWNASYSRL